MLTEQKSSRLNNFAAKLALLSLVTLALVGCGGAGSNFDSTGGAPIDNSNASSSVQVRISGTPSDRIVALGFTFSSVKAVSASGAKFELLPKPGSVEVIHLTSSNEPLVVLQVPKGEFSQLEVSVSKSEVTYLATNNQPIEKHFSTGSTFTVDLNPTITIGADPAIVNIEIDVANTVYLDLASNYVFVNPPVMKISQTAVAADDQHPEDGRVDHVIGLVTSTTSNSFTLTKGLSGMQLTFQTDDNTSFEGASLATLTGAMVEVKGSTSADNALLASQVTYLGSGANGVAVEGLITGYDQSGQMSLVSQTGTGNGATDALRGSSVTFNPAGGTTYTVNTSDFDMEGLPFSFDQSSIMPGQRITVNSHSAIRQGANAHATGSVNASVVELQQQTLTGTVTNYIAGANGAAMFDLVLNANGTSYLNAATPGTTTVHVYQRSTTDLHGISGAISEGQSLQVRGLLFYYNPSTPSSSQTPTASDAGAPQPFAFVASRVGDYLMPPM
jgi:hypothetical protein